MASPAGEALPVLPPIMTPSTASAALESAGEVVVVEDEEPPSTPTSEESRLRPPTECPPAPRKPPAAPRLSAKRKPRHSPSTRVCVAVPRDLSSVFRSVPMPPEKRIRAS